MKKAETVGAKAGVPIVINGLTVVPKWNWSANYLKYYTLTATAKGGVYKDGNNQEHLFRYTTAGNIKLLTTGAVIR
ncbi:hypothetical protein [Nitrospirillum amazonense]|uniref:hypothetical protein n=1 Tax=Nitrospirillum amazonense TaxID=28077 RepID=UPI002412174F|nr:hypothetical protein [Nitrospirillum amazonense]MDG3443711.1 hypothetical protein [Nitrospirillum amazonense]